jgi:sulfur carrier protein
LGGFFLIVKINGKEEEVAENLTVQQMITDRKLNPKTIIVELNGLVLKPDLWKSTFLISGDKMEIIRILGGG